MATEDSFPKLREDTHYALAGLALAIDNPLRISPSDRPMFFREEIKTARQILVEENRNDSAVMLDTCLGFLQKRGAR
jgi:hypothetical protein